MLPSSSVHLLLFSFSLFLQPFSFLLPCVHPPCRRPRLHFDRRQLCVSQLSLRECLSPGLPGLFSTGTSNGSSRWRRRRRRSICSRWSQGSYRGKRWKRREGAFIALILGLIVLVFLSLVFVDVPRYHGLSARRSSDAAAALEVVGLPQPDQQPGSRE